MSIDLLDDTSLPEWQAKLGAIDVARIRAVNQQFDLMDSIVESYAGRYVTVKKPVGDDGRAIEIDLGAGRALLQLGMYYGKGPKFDVEYIGSIPFDTESELGTILWLANVAGRVAFVADKNSEPRVAMTLEFVVARLLKRAIPVVERELDKEALAVQQLAT